LNAQETQQKYYNPDRGPDLRKSQGIKKSYVVREMQERHHEMARLILLGKNNQEVAEHLGCTPTSVSQVRNSPVVKEKLTLMKAARDVGCVDLAKEIASIAPIALERVKEALETGSVNGVEVGPSEILKQANSILDREMGKATQRIDTRNIHGHFTMEDIAAIKQKAHDLAGVPV
jgi:AraC-like DNA-binding protein